MPAKRATTPGLTAWAIVKKRYGNHGTVTSPLFRSTAFTIDRATAGASMTNRRSTALFSTAFCGKPSVSTKPGMTVCTRTPLPLRSAAVERENASCACFAALYGPARRERHGAGDRDDIDDVRVARGLQAGQERAQAPDPAEVVDLRDPLDQLRVDVREPAAGRDARVVDEQVDRRVPLEDRRCRALDVLALGDVADLDVRAIVDLGRERAEPILAPRDEDAPPAAAAQLPREGFADPARRSGDHRDPLNVRTVSRLISTVSSIGSA